MSYYATRKREKRASSFDVRKDLVFPSPFGKSSTATFLAIVFPSNDDGQFIVRTINKVTVDNVSPCNNEVHSALPPPFDDWDDEQVHLNILDVKDDESAIRLLSLDDASSQVT